VLLHNGQASAPLGTAGVVLRHVELTPPAPNSATTPTTPTTPTASPPPNNPVPK
jgi:hypothetical protein